MKKISSLLLIFLCSFFRLSASESIGIINISAYSSKLMNTSNNFSSSTSSSFIFWNTTTPYNVTISDTELRGFLWGPMLGYISLNCQNTSSCASSDFKVSNNDGKLTGYAWGENAGWISFSCDNAESNNCASNNYASTSITTLGEFVGYAWSQNFGWIEFNCSNQETCVSTDWRKPSLRALPTQTTTTVIPSTSTSGDYVSSLLERIKRFLPISSKTLIKKTPSQPKEVTILENLVTTSKALSTSGTDMRYPACTGASCVGDSLHLVPFAFLAPTTIPGDNSLTSRSSFNKNKSLPITTSFATIFIDENALSSVTEKKTFLFKAESGVGIIGKNTFHLFTQRKEPSQKINIKTSTSTEETSAYGAHLFKTYLYNFFHKTVNK